MNDTTNKTATKPPPPPPPPITPGPPLLPKVRETPVPVGGLIPLAGLVAGIAWIVKRRGKK